MGRTGSGHTPKKKRSGGAQFWNKEYSDRDHLALSTKPSEDLQKFVRWLERNSGREFLNPLASVLDLGCGNGRNLIYLAREFGMRGVGYDISREAVNQARSNSADLPLTFTARSIVGTLEVPDASQTLVLDMMTSHFLHAAERTHLLAEIHRTLKPGGWLFYKTFLLDEDRHAARLLKEHPAPEPGSYIHPEIGVQEHVSTQAEIAEAFGEQFEILKVHKSHRHLLKGRAHKRRSIVVYAQKLG